MTIEEFFATVEKSFTEHKEWRAGQAAFNTLARLRPKLANLIRESALDPFNNSDKLPLFYAWLQQHWDD